MGTPPIGGASGWGLRSLADSYFRYWQPSLPAYLRYQNSDQSDQPYTSLGFIPSVTGDNQNLSGFTDLLIDPPADVVESGPKNIGATAARLQFGSKTFLISDTFVANRMAAMHYTEPGQVWRDPLVMGIFYGGRLFSIEDITHEDVGGVTTLWHIVAKQVGISSPLDPNQPGEEPVP